MVVDSRRVHCAMGNCYLGASKRQSFNYAEMARQGPCWNYIREDEVVEEVGPQLLRDRLPVEEIWSGTLPRYQLQR